MRPVRVGRREPTSGRSSSVERLVEAQRVGGSIPSVPAKRMTSVSKLGNAAACKAVRAGSMPARSSIRGDSPMVGHRSASPKTRVRFPFTVPTCGRGSLADRQPSKLFKAGSIPAARSNIVGVSSSGRASASKTDDQGSIPCTPANPPIGHGLSHLTFNQAKRVRVSLGGPPFRQ